MPDDRDRHGEQRDDRGAPGLQEEDDDKHHQQHGDDQRLDHLLDRRLHEARRVVDDVVAHARREVVLELLHLRAHGVRERERVRARRLENGDRGGFLVVEQAAQRVRAGGELDPAQVAHADQAAGCGVGAHDDVGELLLGREAPLCVDVRAGTRCPWAPARANCAGGDLRVLLADRGDHFACRDAARRELARVEPDHASRSRRRRTVCTEPMPGMRSSSSRTLS